MNEYEIGRDIQEMRCRIERLETACEEHSPDAKRRHSGVSAEHKVSAGVAQDHEPRLWKPEKALQLPPFLPGLLGLPDRLLQFDLMPESKTWTCHPEPLILSVNWFAGGSDEFYRLQGQVFSIIRVTEPNSGHISCSAIYSARLVASGKASSHTVPATTSLTGFRFTSQFAITLRGAQGSFLGSYTSLPYSVSCRDNIEFVQGWEFNAGEYDLVTGATWEVIGAQNVDRC